MDYTPVLCLVRERLVLPLNLLHRLCRPALFE